MTAPQRHDCAVAFCCDRKFYPFALFMVWQIAHHNPFRTFDFVISSQDDLEVPDWAKPYGIVMHKTGPDQTGPELGLLHGSMAPLFRIALARELGDRYRRILYLDSDMFIEGGDINRLLEVDLGPHPIGAALDAMYYIRANFRATEYAMVGLPALPYANTGMQVIDTRAYRDQQVEERALEMYAKYPDAIILTDQSMTNLALRGKFAQLAPCWNWQMNQTLPLVPMRYPVFFRHFVNAKKPDRDATGRHEVRFIQAYRDFFEKHLPEALGRLPAPFSAAPMSLKQSAYLVLWHLQGAKLVNDIIARHPDPYRALV